MSGQLPLLALNVVSLQANPFDGADLKHIAHTQDGQDFACKSQREHAMLPASEWLCYRMAEACQCAVPYSALLRQPDGTLDFGSRIEGGISKLNTLPDGVSVPVALAQSAAQISAVLALDLFIGNHDRHLGNFLFRRDTTGKWRAMAFDFSRALLVNGFPDDPLPMPPCNTLVTLETLRKTGLFDGPAAVFAISALQSVKQSHLNGWLTAMPEAWLSAPARANLIAWWQSQAMFRRIETVLSLL